MRFTIAQLDEKAKSKPQGYREDVLAASISTEEGMIELTQEAYETLAAKWRVPGFMTMLKNLGTAAQHIVVSGPNLRPIEEIKTSLMTCLKCPFLIEKGFRCGQCGCNLELKVQFAAWHCPVGKW